MRNPNTAFKKLMKEHGLTRKQTAELMGFDISTIDRYLVPATVLGERNPTFRRVSAQTLELFQFKLDNLKESA